MSGGKLSNQETCRFGVSMIKTLDYGIGSVAGENVRQIIQLKIVVLCTTQPKYRLNFFELKKLIELP